MQTAPDPSSFSPPPLPPSNLPPPKRERPRGFWFAILSLGFAGLGIIPGLVYFFNALECHMPGMFGRSGITGFVLLMCLFGLLVHTAGLALGVVGTILGAKHSGIAGIICNAGYLLFIVLGALIAAS